jgi:hypothetical protein
MNTNIIPFELKNYGITIAVLDSQPHPVGKIPSRTVDAA